MLPIRAWRIYYADGSTFSSEDGTWADAPPFGLKCVVWYHEPPYKTIDSGGTEGLVYYQSDEFADTDVKMGLWTDGESHYRIMDLAQRSVMPE
jgi:hypothetical protein